MSEDIKSIPEEEIEYDEPQKLILSLDDGTEEVCCVLSIYELDDRMYIALLPESQLESEDEEMDVIYVYRYDEDDEGNPILDNIEDDDEYERAVDALDRLFEEEDSEEAEE